MYLRLFRTPLCFRVAVLCQNRSTFCHINVHFDDRYSWISLPCYDGFDVLVGLLQFVTFVISDLVLCDEI
jgi:hypothetical protein